MRTVTSHGGRDHAPTRPYPRPEDLEQAAIHEREHELDTAAERERIAEEAVPPRHPFRRLLARLRRHH